MDGGIYKEITMGQTLTDKNLKRLILLTKPFTVKRMYYILVYAGSYGYCSKCNFPHAGQCNRRHYEK